MQYDGKYKVFDLSKINTYPLSTRSNKVTFDDLVRPGNVGKVVIDLPDKICNDIEDVKV